MEALPRRPPFFSLTPFGGQGFLSLAVSCLLCRGLASRTGFRHPVTPDVIDVAWSGSLADFSLAPLRSEFELQATVVVMYRCDSVAV